MRCSICGKDIKGYGNSTPPLVGGDYCDECNSKVIVPYRVFLLSLAKKNIAILITQNEVKLIKPKDRYFTLKELQEAVEGNIEIAPRVLDDYVIVVNEEGLLKGLPYNELAYKLFRVELVGNVLICPLAIFEEPEE